MLKGTERKTAAADSLAGATQVVATPRSAPSLSIRAAQVQDVENSTTSRIGRSLGTYATEQLQLTANKENEKAVLDGQMAYQQGKAIEDVEMGGNKWALSGYRLMQAQTISSSMLASQQELINQKGYQDDPDVFRRQYVDQLEEQIDGLDKDTARMVRETMTQQMPTLVAQHTKAHLAYQEGEAFKALSYSIDTVSKDETATQALIAAVKGGVGSTSHGLSDDRRRKAVAEGVVRAFQNGNPQAYSKLKQAGVLEDLSTTDKNAIEAARNKYQSELRTSYNEKFIVDRNALLQDISTGEYSGKQSMEAFAKLYADHGINITATEANAAYVAGEDAVQYELEGDAYLLKQAEALGDDEAVEFIKAKIARQGGPRPATAQARMLSIKEAYKELEEQSDLQAQEDMRLAQISIDAKLEAQEITPQQYVVASRANRQAYGVKQSAAITGRMVSTIEQVHKANRSRVDANRREALDAQFQARKAQFTSDISKEGILPDEAGRLVTEYRNDVMELYASQGVSLASMNYASITGDAASKYYAAEQRGLDYLSEKRVIEHAARTGTLSELTEKQQRKYWQDKSKAIAGEITAEIERGGLEEKEANKVVEQALLSSYVQAGTVDPQVRAESISALGRASFVNSQGEVDNHVVQTVQAYANLREADPRVAATMLDEVTQLRADQIIEAAGGPNGDIQTGVFRYDEAQAKVGGFEANKPEITDATVKRVRRAVKSHIGRDNIGFFQATFTEATHEQRRDRTRKERAILKSKETADLLERLVTQETTRLAFLDPGSDPRLMVKTAMNNIAERTAFVGDTLIIMKQGKGIKQQLFGAQAADMDGPDVVNEVIVDYLQDLSKIPGNEFISEVGMGGQLLSNLGEGIGLDVDRPVIGISELSDIAARGVRPFTVLSADGESLVVRIRTETGALSEPIPLDLPTIGQDYIKKYKRNLAAKEWWE
jgi:hypothetical protein